MKKSWLKKGIILFIITAIFLAPFSGGMKINKINAQNPDNTVITITKDTSKSTGTTFTFDIKIENATSNYMDDTGINNNAVYTLYSKYFDTKQPLPNDVSIIKKGSLSIKKETQSQNLSLNISDLKLKTDYFLVISLTKGHMENIGGIYAIPQAIPDYTITGELQFNTASDINSNDGIITESSVSDSSSDSGFGCGITNPGGCVAQVFYWLATAASLIPLLAGYFLDFFVYYSTNSTSYDNELVSQAWGAVRDVANMFFILVLLYVAIKTILGLNVTDNKKLISAVIIIALIINFSLFATKVVIDASNILAKVFYNNISSKTNVNGNLQDSEAEAGGQKSISIGLVKTFNPQKILTTPYNMKGGLGLSIFLAILLMGVYLYLAYIFFSIALLFVARVVSLWISMIFSPIAFLSYALPFNIPGFGHNDWKKSLVESAFLAPAFIFFLYIIILFTGFLNTITYPDTSNLGIFESIIQTLMHVLIPFVIIVMLLTKAKKLAVRLSGDMGAAVNKVGAFAGGLALGAVSGGTALAGRALIGGVGGSVAGKLAGVAEKRGFGRLATGLRDVGKFAQNSSFDIRGVKIAGKNLASTGLRVGSAQTGGFEKAREERINKKQRRAESLKVGKYDPESIELKKSENELKTVENKTHKAIEELDRKIPIIRQAMDDAYKSGDEKTLKEKSMELKNLTRKKKAIEDGAEYEGDLKLEEVSEKRTVTIKGVDGKAMLDSNGKAMTREETVMVEKEIQTENNKINYGDKTDMKNYMRNSEGKSLSKLKEEVKNKEHEIIHINQKRTEAYLKKYETKTNKFFNKVATLGQYSEKERIETVNRIRKGEKAPPKEKKSSGGNAGGHAPSGGGHKEEKHDAGGHAPSGGDHGHGGGGHKSGH